MEKSLSLSGYWVKVEDWSRAELGGLMVAQEWTDAGLSMAGLVRSDAGRLGDVGSGGCSHNFFSPLWQYLIKDI